VRHDPRPGGKGSDVVRGAAHDARIDPLVHNARGVLHAYRENIDTIR
jgi:hypothetical protein